MTELEFNPLNPLTRDTILSTETTTTVNHVTGESTSSVKTITFADVVKHSDWHHHRPFVRAFRDRFRLYRLCALRGCSNMNDYDRELELLAVIDDEIYLVCRHHAFSAHCDANHK